MFTRNFIRIVAVFITVAMSTAITPAISAENKPLAQVLFTNVNVFDGKADKLAMSMNVLVEGNLIKNVGKNVRGRDDAKTIDGGGRTLMPGLIDSHVHLTHMILTGGLSEWESATWEEIGGIASASAREFIMSGFTTVRDMGGMGTGFKRVIDRGDLAGPRIYAAGTYISQTAGHADLRLRSQPNAAQVGRQMSNLERLRITRLADGVPEGHCHINRRISQLGQFGSKFRPPCSRVAKRRTIWFEALCTWVV